MSLFCRPKNGGKLCEGENGLYETKVFYFQRPDDPDNFYSENVTEYQDWCKPKDLIYSPQRRDSVFYFRSEKYEDTKRDIKELKSKVSNIKMKIKTAIKQLQKLCDVYNLKLPSTPNDITDPKFRKQMSSATFRSLVKIWDRKIKHRRQLIKELRVHIGEKQDKIDYHLEMTENARKKELWKTVILKINLRIKLRVS